MQTKPDFDVRFLCAFQQRRCSVRLFCSGKTPFGAQDLWRGSGVTVTYRSSFPQLNEQQNTDRKYIEEFIPDKRKAVRRPGHRIKQMDPVSEIVDTERTYYEYECQSPPYGKKRHGKQRPGENSEKCGNKGNGDQGVTDQHTEQFGEVRHQYDDTDAPEKNESCFSIMEVRSFE